MSKPDRIDRRDLAPLVAEGLTEDVPLDRVEAELPAKVEQPGPDLAMMNDQATVPGTRVPLPRFVGEDDTGSVWTDPTGRLQRNARITVRPEVKEAMQAGMICLRCLEPQSQAFPVVCESPPEMGCTYPIRERQTMDIGLEFEGEQHIGPQKPITAYMEEQQERVMRRRFAQEITAGRSRRRG